MFKKKRIALFICALLLGGVAWRVGVLFAAACLGGALALLLLFKTLHIISNRIGMEKIRKFPDYRFTALEARLPILPPERPWRFIVLGDTRNNTKIASALYGHARQLEPVMAFHTGDIVRAGKASELVDNHVQILEKELAPVPLFCIPGNHEQGPMRDFAAFRALYGDDKFCFTYDNCCFAGLNNCRKKGIADAELAWLDEKLSVSAAHKFVFIHIPPAFFEARFARDERRRGFKRNADAFHALMCRREVTEVFMAHIHGYATADIDGVRYTLTAGGGAPLSRRIHADNRHYHMIEMEVAADTLKRKLLLYNAGTWTSRDIP